MPMKGSISVVRGFHKKSGKCDSKQVGNVVKDLYFPRYLSGLSMDVFYNSYMSRICVVLRRSSEDIK